MPSASSTSSVHPRACGEHRLSQSRNCFESGSSPRVRGTPSQSQGSPLRVRFIPARAGEHKGTKETAKKFYGSSPRVRGTLVMRNTRKPNRRFIPARAGNTTYCGTLGCLSPVHPRACGEHLGGRVMPNIYYGSSPRVRGTPRNVSVTILRSSVHPRACGEHSCYKELINNNFCNVKERTRFLLQFLVIIKLLKLVEPFRRRPAPEVRNSRA